MKYRVAVQRIEYADHTFEVDANNKDEARRLALVAAANFDFNDAHRQACDAEVIYVEEV